MNWNYSSTDFICRKSRCEEDGKTSQCPSGPVDNKMDQKT